MVRWGWKKEKGIWENGRDSAIRRYRERKKWPIILKETWLPDILIILTQFFLKSIPFYRVFHFFRDTNI